MPPVSKNKLLTIGLILMVILNIIVLGTLWYVQSDRSNVNNRPQFQNRNTAPAGVIQRNLNFDRQQRREFRQLRYEHMQQMRELRQQTHQTRQQLFNLLQKGKSGQTAESKRDSLINLMAQFQVQMEKAIYEHLSDIRGICTPRQSQEFDRLLKHLMERIGPRHGPGSGPGRQGPGMREGRPPGQGRGMENSSRPGRGPQ